MDLSGYSDAELEAMLKDSAPADQPQVPDLSGYSDAELEAMLGQQQPSTQSLPVPIAPAKQAPTSFLGQMGDNFSNAVQSTKDLLSGNYEDFGRIVPSPRTQALGDKLFPQGSSGSPLDALRNLGSTSTSDWSGALLEKFGQSPEGKVLSAIGGFHPLYNATGAAIQQYALPAIEKATGFAPENIQLSMLAAAPLGLKSSKTATDPLANFAKARFATDPKTKASNIVVEAMQADQISPQGIAQRLAAARKTGAPAVALDVAEKSIAGVPVSGRNLQSLASAAANMPGKGAAIAGEVATRKASQAARINKYLDNSLSKKGYYDISDDVIANIDKYSNPAREKALAYPKNIELGPLAELLDRPAGREALNSAKRLAANAGENISIPEEYLIPQKTSGNTYPGLALSDSVKRKSGLSTRTLHWVKKALDDAIEKTEQNPITGRMSESGRILTTEIKNKINNAIKEQNPDYRKWMETYGDEAARKEALMSGRQFLRDDPEIVKRTFKAFSEPEKQAYLVGVKRELLDRVSRGGDNADAVKRIWNETTRARLAGILDRDQMRALSKQFEVERRIASTDQRNIGGSQTMNRQEFADKIRSGGVPEKALRVLVSPKATAVDFALQGLSKPLKNKAKKMDEATAAEVMKILYTKSPSELMALENLAKSKGLKIPSLSIPSARSIAGPALRGIPYQQTNELPPQ